MGRSPCCDKAAVKRGPWSEEEDARLRSYIEQHGGAAAGGWMALPRRAGLRRCGKSCRLRWLNYLRPGVRQGGFSPEEDRVICALYAAVGSRWSLIAAHLPGRTDNGVKNYWNTRLKKKLLLFGGRNRNHTAAVPPLPSPPWTWTGLPYGGTVDHTPTGAGAGGACTDTIASAKAAIVSDHQPADVSNESWCQSAAATELDEIFRSIVGATGGQQHPDLSHQMQRGMEIETSWYHCHENVQQQRENLLMIDEYVNE